MGIVVPTVAEPLNSAPSTLVIESTLDERWAAWQAKGAAQDRAFRRKMAIVAPILVVVAAIVLYALVGR